MKELENDTDIGTMIKIQCEIDISPENYEFVLAMRKLISLAKKEVTGANREQMLTEARRAIEAIQLIVKGREYNGYDYSSVNLPDQLRKSLDKKLITLLDQIVDDIPPEALQELFNQIIKDAKINSNGVLGPAVYEIAKLLSADTCKRVTKIQEGELTGRAESIQNAGIRARVIAVADRAGKVIKASKERYERNKKEFVERGVVDSLSKSLEKINAETNVMILKLIDDRVSELNKKIDALKSSKTPGKESAALEERKAKLFALQEIRLACEDQLKKHKGQSKNILIDFTAAVEQAKIKYPDLSSAERIKFEKGILESRLGGLKETHFASLKKDVDKELELRNQKISKFKDSSFKAPRPGKK